MHVRARLRHTSQMTCRGVAEQLVDWHAGVETAIPGFSHDTSTHARGHAVRPKEVVGLQPPAKNLGSVITEEFAPPPSSFFSPIRLPAARETC